MTAGSPKGVDVVVVGAGFSGLYLVHKLRAQGLDVVCLEMGDGVGGTWYWNRYPGARCDVPSLEYSYTWSPGLEQEWEWTERYPRQPEIRAYLDHVADRFDLRPHIRLSTRVTAATFDDARDRWTVETEHGDRYEARYVVMATGCLSVRKKPPFEGLDSFAGDWYQTSDWPEEGVDFTGKKVAFVGTGSTGCQAIPQVAKTAEHLAVLQRTPCFSVPAVNWEMTPEEQATFKAHYREHREEQRRTPTGLTNPAPTRPAADFTPEEQQRLLEEGWEFGGPGGVMMAFSDIATDAEANEIVCEFDRRKIREIVKDPATAELLSPTTYPIGARRICIDIDYFETYNRPNVSLVDVASNEITEIVRNGVRLADGSVVEADAIVFAVGFDAMTGALLAVDIRGSEGVALRDVWAHGPQTYLGLGMSGFPNLFTVTGPFSPSVFTNMIISLEDHVDWISDCIAYMDAHGLTRIEARHDAQNDWVDECLEIANATLMTRAKSWYLGCNIPGKPLGPMQYLGGLGPYRERCNEVAANGYEGFQLSVLKEHAHGDAPGTVFGV